MEITHLIPKMKKAGPSIKKAENQLFHQDPASHDLEDAGPMLSVQEGGALQLIQILYMIVLNLIPILMIWV